MTITKIQITIKELIQGYLRDEESNEIIAYAKDEKPRLNIRPKYQREFVYNHEQMTAVIETILQGLPLNIMYWVRNKGCEYEFEVLDGQQRSISICDYALGKFSVKFGDKAKFFHILEKDLQEVFLNYKLDVYICEGKDSEKLAWFKIVNIAGERLSDQELRNAVYASRWLSDAKEKFSKPKGIAVELAKDYLNGTPIRQDYLEKALSWIVSSKKEKDICEYMASHAKDSKNADELLGYFQRVIEWLKMKFPKYRKEMKGLEWGLLYNRYKDKKLDAKELETQISKLMQDDEVTSKKGVYEYVLSGDERHLNLRSFSESIKREVYEKQKGVCANSDRRIRGVTCPHENEKLDISEMEADHIKPWSKGGKTERDNCQLLCIECNRKKSSR